MTQMHETCIESDYSHVIPYFYSAPNTDTWTSVNSDDPIQQKQPTSCKAVLRLLKALLQRSLYKSVRSRDASYLEQGPLARQCIVPRAHHPESVRIRRKRFDGHKELLLLVLDGDDRPCETQEGSGF
jgi:hypothetical protein